MTQRHEDTEIVTASPRHRVSASPLRPLQVVMLFVFAATVGGGYLLLSAAESKTLVDGAIAWQANSPLRALVQTLCLNYEFPTINAGDVKNYILGIGTGLALLALTVAILSRTRPGDEIAGMQAAKENRARRRFGSRGRFGILAVAQVLVLCYILWSMASSRWSSAPALAVGGSLLLAIFFLWSFCLAHSLGHAGARIATGIFVAVGAVSAAVAVWYYYGRNPILAAKFPLGNPSFLATCLIPPIVLEFALAIAWAKGAGPGRALTVLLALLSVGICVWAFALARSRGPAVGLACAIITLWFFGARGKWKLPPALMAIACVAAGAFYLMEFANAPSPTGRSATLRSRFYTWDYAWRIFSAKPLTGTGQGGFALHGDAYVAEDVLSDPLAFVGRAAHAHNEWLEVLSDLGAVGLVLIGGALLLTFWAGWLKARNSEQLRWPLYGLLAAMVGICVAECFGVGLRVAEVPTAFYSVLGLIWAMCAADPSPVLVTAATSGVRRVITGVVGGVFGLAVLVLTQSDFSAAQSAYAAVELLKTGQSVQAVEAAAESVLRLSPQRVLENHYRLIQAHLAAAEKYLLSGLDRAARAAQVQPVDERIYFMATQDLQAADEHTTIASQQLKELVSRSPGYIDHGRLESRINLIRAESAAARGEAEARDAFIRNAAAAIEREMRRQPFDPDLAVEYARIAGATASHEVLLNVLARPLRHSRVGDRYVDVLERLLGQTGFEEHLYLASELLREAAEEKNPDAGNQATGQSEPEQPDWRPEKLRISATVRFLRGDFAAAALDLGPACQAYVQIADRAPMGAGACFAELADALFFSQPDQPHAAVQSADKAIAYAPESETGRQLRNMVEQRMVHYFLAAGDREAALTVLRRSAPADVTEEEVQAELAARARRMIESLVRTRRDWLAGTPEGGAMLQRLDAEFARVSPMLREDAGVHALAAQLGVLTKDADRVAESLRRAIELGLPPEAAQSLLAAAREAGLDSPALTIIQQAIDGALNFAAPVEEVTPAAPSADEHTGEGG